MDTCPQDRYPCCTALKHVFNTSSLLFFMAAAELAFRTPERAAPADSQGADAETICRLDLEKKNTKEPVVVLLSKDNLQSVCRFVE